MLSSFTRITLFLLLLQTCLFGGFYLPDRSAYPALCETHFDNNTATTHTWLEGEDKATLLPFRFFLDIIPKPYEADCYGCSTCGGVNLNLYYDHFDWPTDDALEQIYDSHKFTRKPTYYNNGYDCINEGPDHCETPCWDGGYFRKWNHKYLHFFQHYLQYSSENKKCSCFWPETSRWAVNINDSVYELLRDFAENNLIDVDFSKYWVANLIGFDFSNPKNVQRIDGEEYYPNSHGMASSLLTYTFFYSQYHQVLLDVASYIDVNAIYGHKSAINRTYQTLESIRDDFSVLYNQCLAKHPHPKIYYERGLLKMHSGDTEGAIFDIATMMDLAKTEPFKDKITITSEMYHQEGQAYADLGMYDQAIASLTEAIKLNPENKYAFFDRACAYFETGNFDQALSDYLRFDWTDFLSDIHSKASFECDKDFLKGVLEGTKDGAVDFIPSLCRTAYGMGETLWVIGTNPLEYAPYLVNPCNEIAKITIEYLKNLDREKIEGYREQIDECCEELKGLYVNFNKFNDAEKGQKIGYIIGKYGVDIFAGGLTLKAINTLKKLKQINQICNLQAMAASAANKEAIVAQALKHAAEREAYFKNVKCHFGAQNKHVPGHHHYIKGKSIWEHKDPEGLLKRFAGTGIPRKGQPGVPGFRETVDFKERIGIWLNKEGTIQLPTTRGTIHYSKNGAHIVPSSPSPEIGYIYE